MIARSRKISIAKSNDKCIWTKTLQHEQLQNMYGNTSTTLSSKLTELIAHGNCRKIANLGEWNRGRQVRKKPRLRQAFRIYEVTFCQANVVFTVTCKPWPRASNLPCEYDSGIKRNLRRAKKMHDSELVGSKKSCCSMLNTSGATISQCGTTDGCQ